MPWANGDVGRGIVDVQWASDEVGRGIIEVGRGIDDVGRGIGDVEWASEVVGRGIFEVDRGLVEAQHLLSVVKPLLVKGGLPGAALGAQAVMPG